MYVCVTEETNATMLGALKAVQRELLSRNRQLFTVIVQLNHDLLNNKATSFGCSLIGSTSIRRLSTREMVKAKRFVLVKHFVNTPVSTDLKLVEEELPDLKDGGMYILGQKII